MGIFSGLSGKLLVMPGVVTHEFAHLVVCRLLGLQVKEVVFFQLGSPPGYVKHESPESVVKTALVAFAPLFVNVMLGAGIFAFALGALAGESLGVVAVAIVLVWVGFTAILHSFPSTQDVSNVWETVRSRRLLWLLIPLVFPVVLVTRGVNSLNSYLVTFPLAVGILFVVVQVLAIPPSALLETLLDGEWGTWSLVVG